MKKIAFIVAIALATTFGSAQAGKTAAIQMSKDVFVGEISDSQCATNVHSKTRSHKEMTADHTMGDTKADCVRTCVRKMGGSYVLLTPEGKVYRLSDQTLPDKFAGEKVKVFGALDKSGTLIVEKIEKAS